MDDVVFVQMLNAVANLKQEFDQLWNGKLGLGIINDGVQTSTANVFYKVIKTKFNEEDEVDWRTHQRGYKLDLCRSQLI